MNLKECYTALGADYDDVMRRLVTEERVQRFLSKLLSDRSFSMLCNSMSEGDYETAFRAAHSIKGICMNLGLKELQCSSSALTENLRGGSTDEETQPLFEQMERDYHHTEETIRELLNL